MLPRAELKRLPRYPKRQPIVSRTNECPAVDRDAGCYPTVHGRPRLGRRQREGTARHARRPRGSARSVGKYTAASNSRERFTPIHLVACGVQFSE